MVIRNKKTPTDAKHRPVRWGLAIRDRVVIRPVCFIGFRRKCKTSIRMGDTFEFSTRFLGMRNAFLTGAGLLRYSLQISDATCILKLPVAGLLCKHNEFLQFCVYPGFTWNLIILYHILLSKANLKLIYRMLILK